ncbi:MAG: response regulator [Alphaproteobacteria bacterium]|nr:response regulator [Alphaproteobacteria bacterium]
MFQLFDDFWKQFSVTALIYSSYFWITLLCIIIAYLSIKCIKLTKAANDNEYYIKVIRAISKALSKNQEIAAFDEFGELVFATNHSSYRDKADFFKYISNRINSSQDLKMLYKSFNLNRNTKVLLDGAGSGLNNGLKRWSAATQIVNSDDETWTVVSLYDITKHIDLINKDLKNCERLETFFAKFPFAIFHINSSGEIVNANNSFANMVHVSKDRLNGENINNFIEKFNLENRYLDNVRATLKPKFSAEFDVTIVRAPESLSSQIQTWIIVKDDIFANIKQDKKLEKQNFESQAFSYSQIPYIITEESGNILNYNHAFKSIVEKTKDNKNIFNIIKSNQADSLKKTIERLSANSSVEPVDICIDNSDIIASAYISKIPNSNGKILIQLIKKNTQEIGNQQLSQSQRMQAIGQLAGGIAHDFNNLLTAMIGYCDLLLQRYTRNDSAYGDIVQIKQNAGRAANLVKQLLAFSKQQNLKPKTVFITDMLIDISSLLRRLIGIDIELEIIHGRDIWPVKLDGSQFDQVIVNLAVNARDAIKGTGKITIRTKNYFADSPFRCTCDTAEKGDYVLIEFSDTGCGISKDKLAKIFEPFYSTKTNTNKQEISSGSGTGLGLSSVYGIIKQTGGYIDVISEIGKGTTFKIYLPRYNGQDTDDSIKAHAETLDLSGTETILLVEDEEAVRMFTARALRDKGYKVIEASSAEEAIDTIKNKNFDILISDVIMPKIDGPTLNKMLREKLGNKFKTIFISGYSEDTFRRDLSKNASIHFLQKPFTLKDIATKVKEVTSNNDN